MLGYVKAFKPELKVKDYEVYKGVYCSLCKCLGRDYSPFAQLLLSYDFVFLALIKMSVSAVCPSFKKNRCHYNPLVKCNTCSGNNSDLEFCADAVIIMAYYKIMDNLKDGGFLKKLASILIFPAVSLMHKKAKRRSQDVEEIISAAMKEQQLVEQSDSCGIDMAAEPTARALSKIFALGEKDEQQRILLERLGYLIGRWVYSIDAVDDLNEDIKTENFNPLKTMVTGTDLEEQRNSDDDDAHKILSTTAGEAVKALNLLEIKRFHRILENIVYDGLENTAQAVLKNKGR